MYRSIEVLDSPPLSFARVDNDETIKHRILQAAPRKLSATYGRLSFQLAQNLQSRRERVIRDRQKAKYAIAKYMTRLIKSAAALHIILTYYYNEFHFRICDEEDVEVIEVLHSLYPLHRPVVAHCLTDSLSQSIIQSNLEMGMAVVCIRVIG
ncbi:hypothetical protein SO802_020856 [Lithocarpus litseifolius]|uniref:Uncharacterized protein n=1 Tax=Lithocarpus litseifolius TaxID=425828 RepID=A0AAW2CD37_9ROSI